MARIFLIMVLAGASLAGLPAPSEADYAVDGAAVEMAVGVRLANPPTTSC